MIIVQPATAEEPVYRVTLVAVPAFEQGYLPKGEQAGALSMPGDPDDARATVWKGHQCSLPEIENALVTAFGSDSSTRPVLFSNMKSLAIQVERVAPCSLYFVTGSFVAELVDPDDVHLVAVVPGSTLNGVDADDKWLVKFLMADREVALMDEEIKLSSELAVAYPLDHPEWQTSLSIIAGIRNAAGYPTDDDREAGYLQFMICEGGDHTDEISELLAPAA